MRTYLFFYALLLKGEDQRIKKLCFQPEIDPGTENRVSQSFLYTQRNTPRISFSRLPASL